MSHQSSINVIFVVVSAFFFTVKSELQFTVTPKNVKVLEGESIVFECQALSNDELDFSWALNGNPIQRTHRVYLNGSNLHIMNVNKTLDSGDYVCLATSKSSGARVETPSAKLDILWTSSPVVQLLKHETEKGNIILKCHTEGSSNDDIKIEWFKNDEKILKSTHIDVQKKKLHIKNATSRDNGVYSCLMRNAINSLASIKNYRLRIKDDRFGKKTSLICATNSNNLLCRGKRGEQMVTDVPVKITTHPLNIVVNESNPAIFNCAYAATNDNLPLIVRWRKDGKVIRQIDKNSDVFVDATEDSVVESSFLRDDARILIDRNNGSLVFNSAISSDEGVYDCQITNNASEFLITSNSAELLIIANLRFTPKPTSKNLELGSVGKIHCKAQGTPSPTVHWASENSTELPDSVDDVNGTLIFRVVSAEHKGNYTCVASNSQGDIQATVVINVVVAPKFELAPEGQLYVLEMGTIFIHCVATGDPKPTIQWDKDLQYLHSDNDSDDDRFRILENGTLVLTEVHLDDEGKYGCTIGNSAGLKREEVQLVVRPADTISQPDESAEDGFLITKAVLITMTVAFTYIILVVGLMLWCRHRRNARKLRMNADVKENGDIDIKDGEIEPCLPEKSPNQETRSKSSSKKTSTTKSTSNTNNETPDKSDETVNSNKSKISATSSQYIDPMALARTSITDMIQIGKSDFGDVFIGKIKENDCNPEMIGETEDESTAEMTTEHEGVVKKVSNEEINEIKLENDYKLILIKALNKVKEESACTEFQRQIELFRVVSSKNVSKLFGICREKNPHYLVLEYTDWGDLKQFLIDSSSFPEKRKSTDSLKFPQILGLAYQIALGMEAIYKARIIHKDLAARNCLISSNYSAKISLPCLCKDKYRREYYKYKNHLVPLRWMAPECLNDDDYSIKSDVFSYGVLVWELFTQATELPFKDLTDEEFVSAAQNGTLEWKLAENTPKELQSILESCWAKNPNNRPLFSQLVNAFGYNMQQSQYTV